MPGSSFAGWLSPPAVTGWKLGSGTGALTGTILQEAEPALITGVDSAEGFVAYAQTQVTDSRVSFKVANGMDLPFDGGTFDAVVSGLVLNFIPREDLAVAEMTRVARSGGVVAAYVWDYAGDMQMMRMFWDAAVELDPAIADKDEGVRFPLCKPEPLAALFSGAGLAGVEVRAIDVPTRFGDFSDYWSPFLGGQGPAPTYVASLTEARRVALRDLLRSRLPVAPDGSVSLTARAWAVRGSRPATGA